MRKAKVTLLLACLLTMASDAYAQPILDTIKAMQQRNERIYRMIGGNNVDDRGTTYAYTNVTTWKITDDDLRDQIIRVVKAQPFGERAIGKIDVDRVYVFAAPAGQDAYEPFHILFIGKRAREEDTTDGGGDDPFGIFGSRRRGGSEDQYIAVKGKDVVRMMQRVPALKEAINTIQGEIFELPGDILPSGVQLVKSSYQRYIFNKMFTGFYSKRQIIDEQRRALGMPTVEEEFVPDTTIEDLEVPMDPDQTMALPDQEFNARAFRYEKTVEIGGDRLLVNISNNSALEVQLGNPEIGMPFTSSGMGRFSYNMRNLIGRESNVKLGLTFPIGTLGNDEFLLFPERRISGGFGGSVEAYFAGIDFFSAFNMPIQLGFTIVPAQGDNASIIYNGTPFMLGNGQILDGSRQFYRTSFIGNLTIPIILQLDPANFLQMAAGIGVHTVHRSFIPHENDFDARRIGRNGYVDLRNLYTQDDIGKMQDIERVSTPVTPRVSIQYVNHRSNKFGLNLLYDHLFTFGGWVEVIDNTLRLDMSYTAPLVRDPKPYEPASFFFITPRLYF